MVYFDACWSRQPENWLPAAPPGFHSLLLIKQLPFPRNWDSLPPGETPGPRLFPLWGRFFSSSSQALAGQEPSALAGPQPRRQLTSSSWSRWDCSERKHLRVLHCPNYKLFPTRIKMHLSASGLFITGIYLFIHQCLWVPGTLT